MADAPTQLSAEDQQLMADIMTAIRGRGDVASADVPAEALRQFNTIKYGTPDPAGTAAD
jgi:hypothetical protein